MKKILFLILFLVAVVIIVVAEFVFGHSDFNLTDNLARISTDNFINVASSIIIPTNTAIPTPTPTPLDDNNFGKDMDYPPTSQAKGTVRIPVLTYHHIAVLPSSMSARDYYVSPTQFDLQMAYLKSKNYKTLTTKEFHDLVDTGKNPPQKSVLITFDDGNADNYINAFPILKKYGLVGVFFVPSIKTGINGTHLKEMADAGMDIEDHSATHIDLAKEENDSVLYSEIVTSRYAIQKMTGKTVYAIAYPGCVYDAKALTYVRTAGYILGFSCGKSIDHRSSNVLALSRIHIYNDMENFKKRLSGIWEYPAGYSD